jgi:sulfide dehydrogenase cytochrome subunit
MNTNRTSGLIFLAGILLLSLGLVSRAGAADVNKLVMECAECHGKDGASKDKDVPIIGGLSAAYIVQTMGIYKEKKRPCPETKYREGAKKGQKTDMCTVAKNLSDEDIKQLADLLASKKFVRAQQTADPALAKIGAKLHEHKCEKCHSESGSVASDDSGILAGQWMPYLAEMLKEFMDGKRPMDKKMKPKIESLKQPDVDALVQYYGSFK